MRRNEFNVEEAWNKIVWSGGNEKIDSIFRSALAAKILKDRNPKVRDELLLEIGAAFSEVIANGDFATLLEVAEELKEKGARDTKNQKKKVYWLKLDLLECYQYLSGGCNYSMPMAMRSVLELLSEKGWPQTDNPNFKKEVRKKWKDLGLPSLDTTPGRPAKIKG